jgi:hypothetical protein
MVEPQFRPEYLVADDLQRLYKTLIIWYSQHHFSAAADLSRLAGSLDPDQQERLTVVTLLGDKELADESDADLERDVVVMMADLKRHALTDELLRIESELRRLEHGVTSESAVGAILERFQTITDELRQLS